MFSCKLRHRVQSNLLYLVYVYYLRHMQCLVMIIAQPYRVNTSIGR